MTAKEILNKKRKSSTSGSHVEYYSDNEILEAMNEFALHIAEQAVEEERERTYTIINVPVSDVILDGVLTRIKQLTESGNA